MIRCKAHIPLTAPFQDHVDGPTQCIKARKENKSHTDWKRKHKTVLVQTDEIILYVEDPKRNNNNKNTSWNL